MKKLLLIIAFLLPLTASAARPVKSVSRGEVASIISEFRRYDGVEVVRMGWLGTALVRGIIRRAGQDEDIQEIRRALRGVKGVTVLEYESAAPDVRYRLTDRIAKALDGRELLMEAKDDGDKVQIFGILDDATGTVRDFVLHVPNSCALICLFGSVPADAVSKMAAR